MDVAQVISQRSLCDLYFSPRRVAVVGASNDPRKLSGRVIDFLSRSVFTGEIIPINPRRDAVQALRAYPSVDAYPHGAIDLAVLAVPAADVPSALEECAAADIRAAIVFASGFAETDGGTHLQEQVAAICHRTGIRVLGPNCLGVIGAKTGAALTFSSVLDTSVELHDGPVAVVAQSGAMATYLYGLLLDRGLGVGYLANTGNEVDVTAAELLSSLLERPDVNSGVMYLEALNAPHALQQLSRTSARTSKPVIVLKSGRTEAGAAATKVHTGSAGSPGAETAGRLRDLGFVQVSSLREAVDATQVFAAGRTPAGNRLTTVSMSGGAGVLMTDDAHDAGLRVDELPGEWRAPITAEIPSYGSSRNPIDMTAEFIKDPTILSRVLHVVTDHPDTDMIAVLLGNAERDSAAVVETLVASYAATSKPMVVVWTGGSGAPREALSRAGVPTFSDGADAARALGHLFAFSRTRERVAG